MLQFENIYEICKIYVYLFFFHLSIDNESLIFNHFLLEITR